MNYKLISIFVFIFLLASAVIAEEGESSSYEFDNSQTALSSGTGDSTSYILTFVLDYQQSTESGASTTNYVFNYDSSQGDNSPYLGPSGGGSGGGGGRNTMESIDFNVSPETLKYFLKTGQEKEKTIIIENKGNESIIVQLRESAGYIGVSEKSITISAYSEKQITILVSAMNEDPGIYSSQITLTSSYMTKEVTLLIEIEEADSSFDVIVDVFEEDKIVVAPKNISANLIIYDLEGSKELNVIIDYFIQDLEGNIIVHESEYKTINSGENLYKNINLPEELSVGDYVLSVKTTYNNETAFSGSIFKVVASEEEKSTFYSEIVSGMGQGLIFLYIGLGILAVFLLFFYYEHNKIILMIIWTKHLLKKEDVYHAKLMFNKIAKRFSEIKFEGKRKDKLKRKIKTLYNKINNS